jgi:DNA-binding NarL/FixJ family response regulator
MLRRSSMPIRLLLLEDHPLFRGGLRAILDANDEFEVVGEAADARAALALLERKRPDVVVADVSLPAMSGVDFARESVRRFPETHVLVLTMHARPELATDAFEAGARGYALKTELPSAIVEAIRVVARGERYLSPTLPQSVLSQRTSDDPLGTLTVRQRAVFSLVVSGLSNEHIAKELGISVKTVQTHRAKVNEKLGVHSTGELVRFAALRGLIAT